MAYDPTLVKRIRYLLRAQTALEQVRMFGGVGFMVNNHLCVGVINNLLIARVGPEHYQRCLRKHHVRKMIFTGNSFTGMVYVEPEALKTDTRLKEWLDLCLGFVSTLPGTAPNTL